MNILVHVFLYMCVDIPADFQNVEFLNYIFSFLLGLLQPDILSIYIGFT